MSTTNKAEATVVTDTSSSKLNHGGASGLNKVDRLVETITKTRKSLSTTSKQFNNNSTTSTTNLSQHHPRKQLTMEDFFYQKMYSDLMSKPSKEATATAEDAISKDTLKTNQKLDNNKKSGKSTTSQANKKKPAATKKPKYKSYHTLLLEKSIEESLCSRGKMQKYVDYNAFNSDDDSDDDPSTSKHSYGLFQRYGLESRMWNEIATRARNKTDELPKWSKHVISKKDSDNVQTNNNNTSKNIKKLFTKKDVRRRPTAQQNKNDNEPG